MKHEEPSGMRHMGSKPKKRRGATGKNVMGTGRPSNRRKGAMGTGTKTGDGAEGGWR